MEQTCSKKRSMQQYVANFLQVSQAAMIHFVKTTTWSLLGGMSSFATNSLGGLTFTRFKEPTLPTIFNPEVTIYRNDGSPTKPHLPGLDMFESIKKK